MGTEKGRALFIQLLALKYTKKKESFNPIQSFLDCKDYPASFEILLMYHRVSKLFPCLRAFVPRCPYCFCWKIEEDLKRRHEYVRSVEKNK
mgnify:CR=1 FL=1